MSRGTVSNVFTHPELVREPLRDKVLAAAEALGYGGPNPRARFLKGGKLNAIGVTPPGSYGTRAAFANPYLREFLGGVAEICDAHGASLTLVSGVRDDNTRGIRNAVVDGFILHRFEEAAVIEARQRRLPCVFIDMDGGADASSVRIDDRAGARDAAAHLVALGHRRFAVVSVLREPPSDGSHFVLHAAHVAQRKLSGFDIDRDRFEGYLDALGTAGISADDLTILETSADVVAGSIEGAAALLERAPDVTAVLAMTDIQALAVLEAARRRGLSVPRDLSVVGFDDIPESAESRPALTTVSHPMSEKGRVAAQLLFEEATGRHVVLPVRLIVRDSTAKAPTGNPPRTRKTASRA